MAVTGAAAAVVGAPVVGVGAAPEATLATVGEYTSLAGTALEVSVEFVAGSNKNAKITVGNELLMAL
ncbi:hypothetical protein [Mucilaginibacter lacusdianchii]|uniref:hypothetical protein n=1 Tax=Mucilaginibacter lacusdianchii TaxID=2684211 RepID=UPI00131B39F8|nr:hypothetical protein [Mucilaginibacter sp. JXJ CY 39]